MKIAFIGAGKVGAPLALHLAEAGHDVVLASTKEGSSSQGAALARSPKLRAEPLAEAVRAAEVVFLATPFSANEAVVRPIAAQLAGKVLVDCTNPVGPGLAHGLRSERSGSEVLQSFAPQARIVKAFSIYGFENFENPKFPGHDVRPTMLFCGDDAHAKQLVSDLIVDCGFDPLDVGGLAQALHLEHMTLLWVRMVRTQGHAPGLVWSALRRPKGTLPYSKLVVFGDGLSDQGRFYALTDGRYPPSPLFLRGRWTKGQRGSSTSRGSLVCRSQRRTTSPKGARRPVRSTSTSHFVVRLVSTPRQRFEASSRRSTRTSRESARSMVAPSTSSGQGAMTSVPTSISVSRTSRRSPPRRTSNAPSPLWPRRALGDSSLATCRI